MLLSIPIPGFTAFVHVKNMPDIIPVEMMATTIIVFFI
jgi:hypothetical protein